MEHGKNISIIGFMASGKSTIGKALAKELSYDFIDTDELIEKSELRSIRSIFETDGESYFRDVESCTIKSVCERSKAVISTGGGAVLRAENVEKLRQSSIVIWLRADRETILDNLNKSGDTRPLMKKSEQESKVDHMLAERSSKYENAAHIIVDVDSRDIMSIVSEILFNLQKI